MAGRAKPDPRWGPTARARLEIAMKAAGHTQKPFAVALVKTYGADRVSQPSVSRWLSGQSQPDCLDAVFAYCDRYAPESGRPMRVPEVGRQDQQTGDETAGPDNVNSPPGVDDEHVRRSPWEIAQSFKARLDALRADLRREQQLTRRQALEVARLHDELAQAHRDIAAAKEASTHVDDTAETYSAALNDAWSPSA